MPEFDPLPGRPRPPVIAPRTGDYAEVVGRAKHRRRRHYSAAGAGVAGLVAFVALTAGGGSGTFGLDPARPAAGVTTTQEPPGGPASPTAEPTEQPSEPAEPAGDPGGSPEPGDPEPSGFHEDSPPPAPTPDPHRPAPVRPVVVRDEVANDPAKVCDTDPGIVTATGWCLRYEGPTEMFVGNDTEFRMLACRHVGRGASTLTFDTEQQVEFVVTGTREEWHWSGGYKFPKRETKVTVAEARCARWTVTWDATGDDGDPLRAGSYSMSPYVMPSDWGNGNPSMSVGSAYSLEIRDK